MQNPQQSSDMNDPDRTPEPGNTAMPQVDHRAHPTGPTSIQGVEASDLPDGGRDHVDTDPRKVNARKLPANTGGTIGGDAGLRAMPDSADAKDHGYRKHN
ncbi:MAG TPA: hypothetical protein VEA69_23355 [Tepidisphaeraceae bacterium]|nr:hypothetical protein [Tepidisphaeraceae bacterium]